MAIAGMDDVFDGLGLIATLRGVQPDGTYIGTHIDEDGEDGDERAEDAKATTGPKPRPSPRAATTMLTTVREQFATAGRSAPDEPGEHPRLSPGAAKGGDDSGRGCRASVGITRIEGRPARTRYHRCRIWRYLSHKSNAS